MSSVTEVVRDRGSAAAADDAPVHPAATLAPIAPGHAHTRVASGGVRIAVDAAALVLAVLVTLAICGAGGTGALLWGFPAVALLLLHSAARSLDDGSALGQLGRALRTASLTALLLIGVDALLGITPRGEVAVCIWVASVLLLWVARLVHTSVLAGTPRPTLIVGAGEVGCELATRLARERRHGLCPIGFLDSQPGAGTASLPLLGTPDELPQVAAETGAECVAFAFAVLPDNVLVPLIRRCEALGLRVLLVPRLFETLSWRQRTRNVGRLPLSELLPVAPDGLRFAIKHTFDRVVALTLLTALALPMAIIALLVRLESPGPAFFRQRRVGRDGRPFTMLKFRTMRVAPVAAEHTFVRPAAGNAPGGVEGIDRRTRLGVLLRMSSLDELPQLINVLRGEMSLVGPRPERPTFAAEFLTQIDGYDARHRVRAGITGLAQVQGLRGQTSLRERVELDNFYIQNWSFWMDLEILLRTPLAVLSLSGR